jgi:membrane protein YdbS with pleckstrin-like domain
MAKGGSTVLVVLAAAQFLMVLDQAVMNVSISQLVEDFDTEVTTIQAVITFYSLVITALMIAGGKVGDLLGRRRAFGLGHVIYGAGSLLTAVSWSVPVLARGWPVLRGSGPPWSCPPSRRAGGPAVVWRLLRHGQPARPGRSAAGARSRRPARGLRRAGRNAYRSPRRVMATHLRRHDDRCAMGLHLGEETVFEGHPSWRGVVSFYATAVGGALLVAIVVGLGAGTAAGIVAGAALVAVALVVGVARRTATRYLVTTRRLCIRRGIVTRRVQQARIGRVQNVNTAQTLVNRILRVGTLEFDTAGTDDGELRFVGVAAPDLVAAAVDRARREARERAATPRFTRGPRTTRLG